MTRKSILVVDDEKSQREILEMILSGEGYEVTTASSGEAAMKFAKDRRFDLALTDLKMTGMDGIELLQQLLVLDSSIIVILLRPTAQSTQLKKLCVAALSITWRSHTTRTPCWRRSTGLSINWMRLTLKSFRLPPRWNRSRE